VTLHLWFVAMVALAACGPEKPLAQMTPMESCERWTRGAENAWSYSCVCDGAACVASREWCASDQRSYCKPKYCRRGRYGCGYRSHEVTLTCASGNCYARPE
jgi:hypothetical protein